MATTDFDQLMSSGANTPKVDKQFLRDCMMEVNVGVPAAPAKLETLPALQANQQVLKCVVGGSAHEPHQYFVWFPVQPGEERKKTFAEKIIFWEDGPTLEAASWIEITISNQDMKQMLADRSTAVIRPTNVIQTTPLIEFKATTSLSYSKLKLDIKSMHLVKHGETACGTTIYYDPIVGPISDRNGHCAGAQNRSLDISILMAKPHEPDEPIWIITCYQYRRITAVITHSGYRNVDGTVSYHFWTRGMNLGGRSENLVQWNYGLKSGDWVLFELTAEDWETVFGYNNGELTVYPSDIRKVDPAFDTIVMGSTITFSIRNFRAIKCKKPFFLYSPAVGFLTDKQNLFARMDPARCSYTAIVRRVRPETKGDPTLALTGIREM